MLTELVEVSGARHLGHFDRLESLAERSSMSEARCPQDAH